MLLSIIAIIVQSCDPIRHCRFYVVNDCNEDIITNVLLLDGTNLRDTIKYKGQRSYLMTHYQPLREENVLHIEFDTITIGKNNIHSKINCMDHKNWKFEEIDKFNWKATLIVKEEDFEE